MAVLSYVCLQFPDTKLSIIFLPMYTFAAGSVSIIYYWNCSRLQTYRKRANYMIDMASIATFD